MLGLIGLVMGLIVAGGVVLIVEGLDDDDDGDRAEIVCSDLDASALGALVIVSSPPPGGRVAGSFTVSGCAATFEQNVRYRLTDRTGAVLARGFTTASSPDVGIAGDFSFDVETRAPATGMLSLEVFEGDASGGQGGPPPRQITPLIAD